MEITEVRIKLLNEQDESQRLKAFCSITFDDMFVVRDLRVLQGTQGYFVAMPSRKLTFRCAVCRQKNSVTSRFCTQCGAALSYSVRAHVTPDASQSRSIYVDVVHPINSECRELVHNVIIKAYEAELERVRNGGAVQRFDEDFPDAD
ncbi:MAG: SpoVG family protein [Planctomycetia bacterium]|nr:SpoVG family protein [Planctomycetia bacterium]